MSRRLLYSAHTIQITKRIHRFYLVVDFTRLFDHRINCRNSAYFEPLFPRSAKNTCSILRDSWSDNPKTPLKNRAGMAPMFFRFPDIQLQSRNTASLPLQMEYPTMGDINSIIELYLATNLSEAPLETILCPHIICS